MPESVIRIRVSTIQILYDMIYSHFLLHRNKIVLICSLYPYHDGSILKRNVCDIALHVDA